MYQSRGPYQICKAPRAVRPESFSNLRGWYIIVLEYPFKMYFILLEICDFYALSKLKSRLCIRLTFSIDLNPTIFLVYFGGNDFK